MRVRIDRNLCTGLGNCVALAPTVFALDVESKVIILDPTSIDDNALFEVVKSCPYDAIMILDDEGLQVYS